jgi:hypothetical protein
VARKEISVHKGQLARKVIKVLQVIKVIQDRLVHKDQLDQPELRVIKVIQVQQDRPDRRVRRAIQGRLDHQGHKVIQELKVIKARQVLKVIKVRLVLKVIKVRLAQKDQQQQLPAVLELMRFCRTPGK